MFALCRLGVYVVPVVVLASIARDAAGECPALFRVQGGKAGALVGIEAVRATQGGQPVLLRRGPVSQPPKNPVPADRFDSFSNVGAQNAAGCWAGNQVALFTNASIAAAPTMAVAAAFPTEIQLDKRWDIYQEGSGEVIATCLQNPGQNFVFDSLAQLLEIARPVRVDIDNALAKVDRQNAYIIHDELAGILANGVDGLAQYPSEAILTCDAWPDECLFVTYVTAAAVQPRRLTVLWLPRNNGEWAPIVALKAFGKAADARVINCPADKPGVWNAWKYEKLRSMAYFPEGQQAKPTTGNLNVFGGFTPDVQGKVPVKTAAEWWDAQAEFRAYWQIINDLQDRYTRQALAEKPANGDAIDIAGRSGIGFHRYGSPGITVDIGARTVQCIGPANPEPDSLHAEDGSLYPEILDVKLSTGPALHFVRVLGGGGPVIYVQDDELTVQQLLGVIVDAYLDNDNKEPTDDKKPTWWNTERRNAFEAELKESAKEAITKAGTTSIETPNGLALTARDIIWASEEYSAIIRYAARFDQQSEEQRYAGWLFELKWSNVNDAKDEWTQRRAWYELGQLRPYFLQRCLQRVEADWAQAPAVAGQVKNWAAFEAFVKDNGLLEDADIDAGLTRYKLVRQTLQTGREFSALRIDSTGEPVSMLSIDNLQRVLKVARPAGNASLRVPTFAEWNRLPQAGNGWSIGHTKPWSSETLRLGKSRAADRVRNLDGNLSEVVFDSKGYWLVGAHYREALPNPVPIHNGACSQVAGFRLVLDLAGANAAETVPDQNPQPTTSEDVLYKALWGLKREVAAGEQHPWQTEQQHVFQNLGKSAFWLVEHLRLVMCGSAGTIDSNQLLDQLPNATFLDQITPIVFGNNGPS